MAESESEWTEVATDDGTCSNSSRDPTISYYPASPPLSHTLASLLPSFRAPSRCFPSTPALPAPSTL